MTEEVETNDTPQEMNNSQPAKSSSKPKSRKSRSKKKKVKSSGDMRKRTARPYPKFTLQESLGLGEAIHKYASGEKVRRLTLLKHLDKSPTSSTTQNLITNSSKYGLTKGSYLAEWLELTGLGTIACNPDSSPQDRLQAQFNLAVDTIPPFQHLYAEYKGKRLPTHDVLKDVLIDGGYEIDDLSECVDIFIVNAKFLGILQTIAGSETLISLEQAMDEVEPADSHNGVGKVSNDIKHTEIHSPSSATLSTFSKVNWAKTCFVITPIGEDGSNERKHADLFLGSLIEPALREFGLDVVRADKIGAAGMITSQILEYVMRSRLAIVDLSYHNPNAFYEMAIRHACKLPVIQISRKSDRLPFDVNQVRTVVIDTTDIFTLVPKLETYKSEIATQARAALNDDNSTSNPITVFFPGFEVFIPKEK